MSIYLQIINVTSFPAPKVARFLPYLFDKIKNKSQNQIKNKSENQMKNNNIQSMFLY